jgi:hypothetical protein
VRQCIHELSQLSATDDASYQKRFALLESVSKIKFFALLTNEDVDGGSDLIVQVFTTFYQVIAATERVYQFQIPMQDILVNLLELMDTIPSEIIEILLKQLLDHKIGEENEKVRLELLN